MSEKRGNSPRSVSSIDAKSIRIGSRPPSTGTPPIDSSPEAQEQSPADHHPENPPGSQLLNAMWPSPDRSHQTGTLDRRNNRFKNLQVNSVADAVERALKLSSEGNEAFFACAEYLTPNSRAAANASGACGFWMDIDCGKDKAAAGKGYTTVKDAEDALSKFCEDTGLNEPTHIVYSGGGLHIYWVLYGVISRDTWQSHARKLKDLCKACAFLADDSRTADIASVLRVPGTLNHKYSPPRLVVLKYASDELIERSAMVDAIAGAHARLCSAVATKPPSHPSIARTTTTGNAEASNYGPPELARLASALATLDPDCDEETWKLRRLAPLALEAFNHPSLCTELYELARSWSSGELVGKASTAWNKPGGNGLTGEEVFDAIWHRFYNDKYVGVPVTLGTVYFDAMEAGWVDSTEANPEEQFEIIDITVEGNA